MKLSALLQNIEVETIVGNKDTEIQSIAFDSRKVGKGTLFAAIKGTASDGHDYIEKAIAAGANVIVHESETEKSKRASRTYASRTRQRPWRCCHRTSTATRRGN